MWSSIPVCKAQKGPLKRGHREVFSPLAFVFAALLGGEDDGAGVGDGCR